MNDMVIATFSKEEAFNDKFPKGIQQYVREKFEEDISLNNLDVLFRVKKVNSNGVLALRPHNIAKEEADTKCWRPTISSLKLFNPHKVIVSPTGKIKNVK
jgi:hypothetical protein